MALRAETSFSSLSTTALSHLVGLPVFRHEANSTPTMNWDKWLDLFQVAILAKISISNSELTRDVPEQTPMVRALLGDMVKDPCKQNKKLVSVMYLSLAGRRGKKTVQRQVTPYNTVEFKRQN